VCLEKQGDDKSDEDDIKEQSYFCNRRRDGGRERERLRRGMNRDGKLKMKGRKSLNPSRYREEERRHVWREQREVIGMKTEREKNSRID